jgi:hypothetical protein
LTAEPAWARIPAFSAAAGAGPSPLAGQVDHFWLEFDLERTPEAGPPVPGVLFGLREEPGSVSRLPLVEEGLALLSGAPLPTPVRERVQRCAEASPPGGRLVQAGAMLARAAQAVRLCVSGIAAEALPAYLGDLGWEDPRGGLRQLLEGLTGLVEDIVLSLDVGPRLLPRIGLECYVDHVRKPWRDERTERFLAHLEGLGLCLPERREALLAWAGCSTRQSAGNDWPEALSRAAALMGGRREAVILRGLNHIKLAYWPQGRLQAKAYFGLKQMWVTPAELEALLRHAALPETEA